jgi:hypothetical protein
VTAPVELTTPLGQFTVDVTCGSARAGEPLSSGGLPSGAVTARWDDVGGLDLDVLLVRFDTAAVDDSPFPPVERWGADLRLHALCDTGPITVTATLDAAVDGEPDPDDGLTATEFAAGSWRLVVGGPSPGRLHERATTAKEPRAWHTAMLDRHELGEEMHARGVTWRLPGLRAGESASTHVVVAWFDCVDLEVEHAAWLAVDVDPRSIREAAGVPLVHLQRQRRRRLGRQG